MIEELKNKTKVTRELTQGFRKHFALNRASAGFAKDLKDLTFTLYCERSEGAFIYDVDGNQYIDLTMGFGSILFGHNYAPLKKEIIKQLENNWSVGPITPLAGQLAAKINQVNHCNL